MLTQISRPSSKRMMQTKYRRGMNKMRLRRNTLGGWQVWQLQTGLGGTGDITEIKQEKHYANIIDLSLPYVSYCTHLSFCITV